MKLYTASTHRRPRSFDRLLLTLLLAGSTAMLIVACSQERRQSNQQEAIRSIPAAEESSTPHQSNIEHHSYSIHQRWSQVPEEMAGGIDAAINWENGDYTWFRGARLATLGQQAENGSRTELQHLGSPGSGPNAFWPGFPVPDAQKIDAAIHWDGHTAYFFAGKKYIAFDQRSATFSSPRPLSSKLASNPWRQLPASFQSGIDAAVNDGLGNIFLFKGNEYLRFDRYLGQVLEGPSLIAERWPVMPQQFHGGIDAAMRLGRGKVVLFRDGLNVEVVTSEAL